ncbi:DUF805 domain-containing protein [Gelidibacter japonicus]|jgi:uncharacterized membrane protein YhaH (DUF805 family)|uniref:DUF805 domain-containing protein n=1 Tax=Gelidibacter japonicus TaxID=1962232 RepID=UPI0013D5EDC1|nr:DUF805 domain-containing protein [Gelidibacter japonicus]
MNWYLDAFKNKYADFSGRARRTEYWMFMLFHILTIFLLVFLSGALSELHLESMGVILLVVYILASFIPALAITVRRLHDSGKSGWFYLLTLIPYIGSFILLIFTVQDSEPMQNKWGPNPKGPNTDEINEIGKPVEF